MPPTRGTSWRSSWGCHAMVTFSRLPKPCLCRAQCAGPWSRAASCLIKSTSQTMREGSAGSLWDTDLMCLRSTVECKHCAAHFCLSDLWPDSWTFALSPLSFSFSQSTEQSACIPFAGPSCARMARDILCLQMIHWFHLNASF